MKRRDILRSLLGLASATTAISVLPPQNAIAKTESRGVKIEAVDFASLPNNELVVLKDIEFDERTNSFVKTYVSIPFVNCD